LLELATGDSPVELLFEMQRNLLAYAQAFERLELLKLEMGLGPGETIEQSFGPGYKDLDQMIHSHKNPFKRNDASGQNHPAEQALWKVSRTQRRTRSSARMID
jgi:hypothetical protein